MLPWISLRPVARLGGCLERTGQYRYVQRQRAPTDPYLAMEQQGLLL